MPAVDERFDCVILGAGFFGLHAARVELGRGRTVLLVEQDGAPFRRASLINQARVHLGYHYPRSLTTGLPSIEHFHRFCKEFEFAILDRFRKIYAISNRNSYVSASRFESFCGNIDIPLRPIDATEFFRPYAVSAAYETSEVAFDGAAIGRHMFERIETDPKFSYVFDTTVIRAERDREVFAITLSNGRTVCAGTVVNCTYGGTNQIRTTFGEKSLDLKYELTEIVLGKVSSRFANVGLTIMDGPFFSVMPWGEGRLHSLTAVQYTPRRTSLEELPTFACMDRRADCTPRETKNCDTCPERPRSSRDLMLQIAKKYLVDDFGFDVERSHYAVKTILKRSEVDDSRPTLVERTAQNPDFVSVLSGKINTLYEYEHSLYGNES